MPTSIDCMFIVNSTLHNHFTRRSNGFYQPPFRLEVRKRSICVQGPFIWNNMFEHFNINVMIPTFKYHLKRYLLENEVKFPTYVDSLGGQSIF